MLWTGRFGAHRIGAGCAFPTVAERSPTRHDRSSEPVQHPLPRYDGNKQELQTRVMPAQRAGTSQVGPMALQSDAGTAGNQVSDAATQVRPPGVRCFPRGDLRPSWKTEVRGSLRVVRHDMQSKASLLESHRLEPVAIAERNVDVPNMKESHVMG